MAISLRSTEGSAFCSYAPAVFGGKRQENEETTNGTLSPSLFNRLSFCQTTFDLFYQIHSFIHSLHTFQKHTITTSSTKTLIPTVTIGIDRPSPDPLSLNPRHTHSLIRSLIMFFPIARLSIVASTLLLPIYVQAVAFTVNSFKGIAVDQPFNLTWSGENTVRALFHFQAFFSLILNRILYYTILTRLNSLLLLS